MSYVVLQGVTFLGAQGGVSDPIGTAITENAKKMQAIEEAENSASSSGGSDSYSGSGYSGVGSGTGSSTSNTVTSSMSKSERSKISKMKNSNVPYYYKHDENDLMYLAASEKRDFVWKLKEEVFL